MQIDTAGTYLLKYTAEDECGNVTEVTREVVAEVPPVYGVLWDGSESPVWTRTDKAVDFANPQPAVANGAGSSPFDNIMPWSGMQIVEDAEAGTLVSIPKFWFKWTLSENNSVQTVKLQIANGPVDGFLVSPAHADRGDGNGERDVVYVGRYHCSDVDYKSTSGVLPKGQVTRADFRTNIHALGNAVWQYDYAMFWTIRMLYLVEFANWNSQVVIGYGCSADRTRFNMGATDAMQYHTGTDAASRDTYGSVQYRHIEGLWDNVYDWVDGINSLWSNDDVLRWSICNDPNYFTDTITGDYIMVGSTASNSLARGNAIPKKFNTEHLHDWMTFALVPIELEADSSYSKWVCDSNNTKPTTRQSNGVVFSGGAYYNQQYQGIFHINASYLYNSTLSLAHGGRLMKLPSA